MAASLALAGAVVGFGLQARHAALSAAEESVSALSIVLSDYVDRLVEITDLVRRETAAALPAGESPVETRALHDLLVGLVASSPNIADIWIGNAFADAVATSRVYPAPGLNAADRDYFKAVRDDPTALHIGILPDNRFIDEVTITTSRALVAPDGRFLGFIQVSLRADAVRDLMTRLRGQQQLTLWLFDGQGQSLLRAPNAPGGVQDVTAGDFLDLSVASGLGGAVSPIDGKDYVYGWVRSSRHDLVTAVGISLDAALAGWRGDMLAVGTAAGSMIIAIGIAGFAGVRAAKREEEHTRALQATVTERTAGLTEALAEKDLLLAEMRHRVKNAFATVQAIHRQSARHATDLASYSAEFDQRLQSLSTVQILLAEAGAVEAVQLHDLVGAELSPYVDASRCDVDGDPIRLSGKAALALTLVIHELTTNAVKHGALSAEWGMLYVDWIVDRKVEPALLRLTWREVGGPPVRQPDRHGFGMRILERALRNFRGGVTIRFEEYGLVADVTLPITDDVAPSRSV
ncbi:sensor histidine kinase [Salinarimonas rosea]|uniref:sensor histidine kinase n=1 Tax=Salinarimonas rosea TaxID=552063 RepID=UPI00040D609C|nr:sensor histidine kinase [Salinarimonas rosea]